ncbi:VWA domain-containing protein [Stomatohabitans albus]|uniref:VWA domain-containing protein n=1 Tax=Stomatohabitans albus TaxID=3110766 RepID=UPI00300C540B
MITFARPLLLLLLIAPVLVAITWAVVANRRSTYALRLADTSLFEGLVSARPSWRGIVPGIGMLVASSLFIIAAAGPQAEHYEDVEASTVVLVFDISVSMLAKDVSPNRLEAAKKAAESFVDAVPDNARLGLVLFNQTVTPAVNPRVSRDEVKRALQEAQPDFGTAMGDAINSAVQMIKADLRNRNVDDTKGATIVVLGDGETTVGNPSDWGAQQAKDADIPVSTIVFGTGQGEIWVDGLYYPAPAAPDELKQVASITNGQFYETANQASLTKIFDELGTSAGKELVYNEFTWPWILVGVVFLLAAFVMNLVWFRRLL